MNNNNIIVHLYMNFDDIDDFKEEELDINVVGEYIYNQEKLGWKIDPDEHSIAEQIYLQALKNDFLYSMIIDELYSLQDILKINQKQDE